MSQLRRAGLTAALLATSLCALAPAPAPAAEAPTACDPALAPGLTWSAPSFLAWGRTARIGANVADAGEGPYYEEDSVALAVTPGGATAADDPADSDLEFAVRAPARATALAGTATWALADETSGTLCTQTAALRVPLGEGETLRFTPRLRKNGVSWVAAGAGDCHDIAVRELTLTVRQGAVTRRLSVADQCAPAGTGRAGTADWEIVLVAGQFQLNVLKARSSVRTRLRYTLRAGSRRVSSGVLSVVRTYRPGRLIVVADVAFQDVCVHGIYPVKWYGATIGCKLPGALSMRLRLT